MEDLERPSLPPQRPYVLPGLEQSPFESFLSYIPQRKKFQHRYRTHIILFLLTVFTTSFTPLWYQFWGLLLGGENPLPMLAVVFSHASVLASIFTSGLWYAVPILLILSAHEFGHYFACRYHDVDATLPYYIPAPVPLTGTFGAVIRIRERFPSKRALFDIGVAGPIAGFFMLLPFLWIGLQWSWLTPIAGLGGEHLGEPLLLKALAYLRFGPIPEGQDIVIHPVAFAAWFGMLATALNLLPFGQLDGGHITYAILGRRAAYASLATLATTLILVTISRSWILTTTMLFAMTYFMGIRHPPIADEGVPLDRGRQLVGLFALIMFVVCFMPIPIDVFQ